MKGVPQGRYTREFRQEAVKLVTEERLSLPEAARRLSLAPSTLWYWVKAQRAGKLGDVGKTYRPLGLDVLGLPVFVVPSWCKFRFGGAASIPPPIVSPRRFPLPVPRRRFGATHVVHGE